MCYDKSDSADNFPESCCVEVLNWKKKYFKWCKISSIHHDDFTQKEKFLAVQIRSRWSWSGRGFCAIFASRIISESGTIFFSMAKPISHYVWFIMADICLLHLDFETILKSDFWPFQIVLSQFKQSWAFEVRGMTFATFGCDLVLLPLPYLVRHK